MLQLRKALTGLFFFSLSALAFGQGVTTAALSGSVSDNSGAPLPGAVILAVHEPTGTRYSALTRADGTFRIVNMRVGGPYFVESSMAGFQTAKAEGVFLTLGEDKFVQLRMQVQAVSEELVVVGSSNPIINPSRTGAASSVTVEVLQELPTMSRGIEDFARTNPFVSTTEFNGDISSITVAGRNNRYNNIQIDGAVNNDLFGLAANGNPGGQAEAQPISLEAIQELQLVIAPYDIRQGGFTGGGVNAVTKTGTNAWKGSAFVFDRSDSLIGDGPADVEYGDFQERQLGFSVGGPLLKDRAFFFATFEQRKREIPSGWEIRPDGEAGEGENFGLYEEAERFRSILMNQYGYDPGGLDQVTRDTDSDNIFVRFDFNINATNQLTLRHNFVEAESLINRPNSRVYFFPSNGYLFPSETNSTVVQWNSTFGSLYNEFRLGYQTIRDRRQGVGDPFPWVNIENLPGGRDFEAGTERFSVANALDQDILEITNDLTFFAGAHTITVGTHNELFSFSNLFIRENYGAYEFASLDDFERGWARAYAYSYSLTDDPQQRAEFDVNQFGFYAGDQWAVNPQLGLTMGVRMDYPKFPDKPTANPAAVENFGVKSDQVPDKILFSPRMGFNYDLAGKGKSQLRGGLGVFSGRTPYVWISNQFGNTGIEFQRLSYSVRTPITEANHIPFEADPYNQPTNVGSAATNEIDLIDKDFSFPQLMRANLAYDMETGIWGTVLTAELIYSKVLNDILYQDLNLEATGSTAFDGRPTYKRKVSSLSNVIYLTNHSEGRTYNAAVKLERPFRDGIYGFVSYAYGDSETLSDGTSSQAVSNWRFLEVQGDPNNPTSGTSDFDVRHRYNAGLSYNLRWAGNLSTNFSFFYEASSGRPFSTVFNGDVNGDGQFSNDLLYIPASADEVIIENGTWADFDAYIAADPALDAARGSILKRNASREPWRHILDFRLAQDVKINRYKFQITFDLLNLANLIDDEKGAIRYVANNAVQPIRYNGMDAATNKPKYRIQFSDPDARFQLDNNRSRWQAKFGLRFTF
jgi:hypothetical protein